LPAIQCRVVRETAKSRDGLFVHASRQRVQPIVDQRVHLRADGKAVAEEMAGRAVPLIPRRGQPCPHSPDQGDQLCGRPFLIAERLPLRNQEVDERARLPLTVPAPGHEIHKRRKE